MSRMRKKRELLNRKRERISRAYDIFTQMPDLPETVYIIGSGPNGISKYKDVPKDAYVIAVNRAGAIHKDMSDIVKWTPSIWMVADPAACYKPYFKKIDDNFDGIRIFSDLVVDKTESFGIEPEKSYIFQVKRVPETEDFAPAKRKLIINGSVAGCALWLCWLNYINHGRLKRIILVGIDMSKDADYMGVLAKTNRHGRVWWQRDYLDQMIRYMVDEGVLISSLSETMLETVSNSVGEPMKKSNNFDHIIDVHDSNLRVPERVVILASGPNGIPHYKNIKKRDYVIAVNRALEIPATFNCDFDIDIWVVGDWRATKKPYFKELYDRFDGIKLFSDSVANQIAGFKRIKMEKHFTFSVVHGEKRKKFKPILRKTRLTSTSAGCAIWLAYILGAMEIDIIGVDMGGDLDFCGKLPKSEIKEHQPIWINRDYLDSQIKYMRKNGVTVRSFSSTKLKSVVIIDDKKDDEMKKLSKENSQKKETNRGLPTVAYLTMAYNPNFTADACFDCWFQDYPNELKTLYLMQQEIKGQYPPKLRHDFPFKILQYNIPGKWPALYLLKLKAFLEVCTSEITIIFDEDDRFHPAYTNEAISVITGNVVGARNYTNRQMERGSIKLCKYRSAIGTTVIKTKFLRDATKKISDRNPDNMCAGREYMIDKTRIKVPKGAALDTELRAELHKRFGDLMVDHEGIRGYRIHSRSNSKGRDKSKWVDFDWI